MTPPERDDALRDLRELVGRMTAPQLVLLTRMARSMVKPIEQHVPVPDSLFTTAFAEAIGDQLLLHHGTHEAPVNKKTFEYVFRNAALAVGRSAKVNENDTDPAADVVVEGTKFSLKTEGAKNQSKTGLQIQKLMEARWIRDVNSTAEIAAVATSVIPRHLERYERIVLLRGLRETGFVRYTLVEIPKDLLMLIGDLTPRDFEEKNEYGGSAADVYRDGVRVFRLRLDGSVEKVRIFSLLLSACVVRGEWRIPVEASWLTQ